jgi:type II secretion system protein G
MICRGKFFNSKGFTLIELMVVISIIGLLASIVLSSLNDVRSKARDTARIQLLRQIETALYSYYSQNGFYPKIQHGLGLETSSPCSSLTENWGHCDRLKILADALAPYISLEPEKLSSATNGNYYFSYASQSEDNWQSYGIMFYLENGQPNDGGYYPVGYELGDSPKYCMGKYTGTDADWLNKTSVWSRVCRGGN